MQPLPNFPKYAAKLTLGGIPLDEQNFSWQLRPGVSPYSSTLFFHRDFLNRLSNLPTPTKIEGEFWGSTVCVPKQNRLEIGQVYLGDIKQADIYKCQVDVYDSRFAFRGRKVTCAYNIPRIRNQIVKAAVSYNNTPREISQNFITHSAGRYLPWSVKPDGNPYSMREILELEFAKFGIQFSSNVGDDTGSFIVENVEYDNVDFYRAIADMCRKSRLQIGIQPNGNLYCYSIDWYDRNLMTNLPQAFDLYDPVSSTKIFFSYKRKTRPKSLAIRFKKKDEVRIVLANPADIAPNFEYGKQPIPIPSKYQKLGTADDIDWGKITTCINVVQTPIPIDLEINRYGLPPLVRKAQIGEYVPMKDYLDAIHLSEDTVRQFWFSSLLENKYAYDEEIRTGTSPSRASRILAIQKISPIRSSYRQLFQIDPFWMDRIEKLEGRRISIIDSYSGNTPPSPLFSDFCTMEKMRNPAIAKGLVSFRESSYNWNVLEDDPNFCKPVPGTIQVVNEKLGIFKIAFQFDTFGPVDQVVPSYVDNRPDSAPVSANKLWIQSSLSEDYTMATIASIVWKADKFGDYDSGGKYLEVPIQLEAGDIGEGPGIEYMSDLEYARFPAREFDEEGNLRIDPNLCVNLGDVDAIATAEARKIMNSYMDRVTGIMTIHGFYPYLLCGHMSSISYNWSPTSGVTSTVDLRDIPPEPSYYEALPPQIIKKLKRQVTIAP